VEEEEEEEGVEEEEGEEEEEEDEEREGERAVGFALVVCGFVAVGDADEAIVVEEVVEVVGFAFVGCCLVVVVGDADEAVVVVEVMGMGTRAAVGARARGLGRGVGVGSSSSSSFSFSSSSFTLSSSFTGLFHPPLVSSSASSSAFSSASASNKTRGCVVNTRPGCCGAAASLPLTPASCTPSAPSAMHTSSVASSSSRGANGVRKYWYARDGGPIPSARRKLANRAPCASFFGRARTTGAGETRVLMGLVELSREVRTCT